MLAFPRQVMISSYFTSVKIERLFHAIVYLFSYSSRSRIVDYSLEHRRNIDQLIKTRNIQFSYSSQQKSDHMVELFQQWIRSFYLEIVAPCALLENIIKPYIYNFQKHQFQDRSYPSN